MSDTEEVKSIADVKVSSAPTPVKPEGIVINFLPKFRPKRNVGHNGGRPGWWDGEEGIARIARLELCFTMWFSDKASCEFAGISEQALYRYERINPDFRDRKNFLRNKAEFPIRSTIIEKAKKDAEFGLKIMKVRHPDEFGEPILPNPNIINFNNIRSAELVDYETLPEGESFEELLGDDYVPPKSGESNDEEQDD